MSLPQVVIVGRPNVGKSSVFNWLAGRRLSIVDNVAGITRDRVTTAVEHAGRNFELVDTGGIGINDVDDLSDEIEHQIAIAMAMAQVVIFLVDARTGITPLDLQIADRVRALNKPLLFVANKVDAAALDPLAGEFSKFGSDVLPVSALQNRNQQALLDAIVARLPAWEEQPDAEPEMKFAIVGRRNVGKSTFINTLVESDRMIVSEVPGTTRDSVDVRFEMDGKAFTVIDTPGVRKRKSVRQDVEFYGLHRAQRSIRRADVVLLFFDAKETISQVDKQLATYIEQEFKPCIFVVNKWDLMPAELPTQDWADYLRDEFPSMHHVPIAFTTGLTGRNMKRLLNHAQMLFKQSRQRVGTGELNRLIKQAIEHHEPPMLKNRRPKILFATQTDIQPPTIVFKCNLPKAFTPSYRRYLLGYLRDQLSFSEVPIRLFFDKRGDEGGGSKHGDEAEEDWAE